LFVGKQSAVGLLGVSRSGAANYIARIEGSDTTINAASIGASPDNLFVFARNVGGSPNQTTDATIAFYSIGTSINLAQLDTRVSNLIASINLYLDIGLNPDNYDQDTINYIYNAYKAGGSLA
jgi:hypothetical protein